MTKIRHVALGPVHFTVAFDAEGVADTIHRNGKIISAAHRDAQRILRNADAIRDDHLPPGFTAGLDLRPRPLPSTATIQSVLRWAEQRRSDADGMAERFAELLSAAGDPLVTAPATDSNWQARAAAADRLRAAAAACG